jgi:NCAIR mutase (PurE)-related protein
LDAEGVRLLLENVRDGKVELDAAMESLRDLPYEELGFAKVDHHRAIRQGFPEVIFSSGKTPQQVAAIAASLHAKGSTLLATRADPHVFEAVHALVPAAVYKEVGRLIYATGEQPLHLEGKVGVICAGTSDMPVAEEAAGTLEVMGATVERVYDVGVAGLHRLLRFRDMMHSCDVLVAVAGMEGAMPSVVAGLVDIPVIAVPTSIGYGASFGGLAALLGMLNSCANGVAVVNIDNGFGAAAFAASILRKNS